jgi:hypothetical protein
VEEMVVGWIKVGEWNAGLRLGNQGDWGRVSGVEVLWQNERVV